MKKQIGSDLCFEDVGIDKAWDETRQAVENSNFWAKDVEVAKAWYQASQAIGKDAEYCASVQGVLDAVLRGDTWSFRERFDESYLCFGTLIRNWKNARNWMSRNETVDRQKHSRSMSDLNLLAKALRKRDRIPSIWLKLFAEAKRDLDYVQSKKVGVGFSYRSSGQLSSRR
ncbi:MAG: hypothetical protein AAGE92_11525 [Cyanobacteria bacterium P01_G01_bin.4]